MDSEVGQFPTQYQGGTRNSPSVCLLVTPACCRELKDFPPRPDGSPVQGIGIRSLLAKWKLGRHGLICSGAAILPSQFIVTTSLQRYMLKPLQHQNGVHLQHAAKGARFLGVISFLVHSRECGLCPSAVSLLFWRPGFSVLSREGLEQLVCPCRQNCSFYRCFPGIGQVLGLLCSLTESQNSPGYSRPYHLSCLSCFIMGLTVHMLLSLSLMFLCSRVELAPSQADMFLQGSAASSSAFEAVLTGRTTLAAILSVRSGACACDWGREALCVNTSLFLSRG